jgi:DNA-binding transcriptional MocR family regulator
MHKLTTPWAQRLRDSSQPAYLLFPELLAEDLHSGRLSPGDRLPPLRELAADLGLNYSTVARAVAEAQRRGLIDARPGRGSFVRGAAPALPLRGGSASEMTMNLPPEPQDPALLERLREGWVHMGNQMGSQAGRMMADLRYQDFGGTPADRDAACRWLQPLLGPTTRLTPDRVLVGPGIHGLLAGLLSLLVRPGETLCVESLTYPGIKALATQLGIKLHAIPVDADGLCPESFEEACKHLHPKALYCNPTMLNPTAATTTLARREALADIALRHNIPIIEDDAYGALPQRRPITMAELAPGLTWYITGFAKCLGAGLRVAYAQAPTAAASQRLAGAMRALTVMASPLTTTLATQWINDGTATAMLQAIRRDSNTRQALLQQYLGDRGVQSQADCFHAWLPLPASLSPNEAASFWRLRGVAAVASTAFATDTTPPRAVRLCLGGPSSHAQVEQALRVVVDTLAHPQQVHASVM